MAGVKEAPPGSATKSVDTPLLATSLISSLHKYVLIPQVCTHEILGQCDLYFRMTAIFPFSASRAYVVSHFFLLELYKIRGVGHLNFQQISCPQRGEIRRSTTERFASKVVSTKGT